MENKQQAENPNGINPYGMNRVKKIIKVVVIAWIVIAILNSFMDIIENLYNALGVIGVITYIIVIGLVLYLFKICYLKAGPIPLYASPIVWVGIPSVAFTIYWLLR